MKSTKVSVILLGFTFFLFWGCTPKVTEETTPTGVEPKVEEPQEGLSPCKKFSDNKNKSDLEDTYVIYRDFLKLKKYDESFDMWKKVYDKAPAADGRRWTVYSDGIKYYQHFLRKETNPEKKQEFINNILRLYEEIGECYPEQADYVKARKAFDLYYEYPDLETDEKKYQMFKEVIDSKENDTYVFVLNPFTKLMVDRFVKGEIDTAEARHYADLVPTIVSAGLKKGENLKSWSTVRDYAVPYIERLEAVKGFFSCDYFKEKYITQFQNDEKTCESVTTIYSKLRYGNCSKMDSDLEEIYNWLKNNDCIAAPPASDPCSGVVSRAYDALRNGDYKSAVTFFEEAITCSTSDKNKSTYNLLISKIYYAHLKNYSKSRTYARKAAALRENWGDPYILIGKLYASSGPLCGPGRGFDSQVVTWAAIDKWVYAKSIDPSVASEANKLIGKYRQYMPSKEDIFLRGLKAGDTFTVPCWIQEKTKVRTSD